MKKEKDPFKIELLDVLNEVGGTMVIKYHTATINLPKESLQTMRDNGFPTDIMSCVMYGLVAAGKTEEGTMSFLKEAASKGAAPSVSFEAAEGETLNISSPEENPMVDMLVQATCK